MTSRDKKHGELESIIDAVRASYEVGRAIDKLESAALPNRRRVADALACIEHVIYMGCYSTRDLSDSNLRQYIGQHMYDAYGMLVEQISRAVVYERVGGGEPTADDVQGSEDAVLAVFRTIPDLRAAVSLDVEAAYAGDPAASSIEEIIFSYPGVQAITVYRIAHEFFVQRVPMVPRIMSEDAHSRTGIDIHPGATIGKSFFIDHGTGVVIGATTVIGNNVKLYQGVTLGALSVQRDEAGALIRERKRHPTIEDEVTIYAGSKILGGDTVIGAGSVIGGNVWVTESVPPNTQISYSMSGLARDVQTAKPVEPKSKTA